LADYAGSINFYMFHGGTNFGFMAGANSRDTAPFYDADVTSYGMATPHAPAYNAWLTL
jgi:beta-galactosidase